VAGGPTAQSATRCLDTGFAALSAQLPGGGWPFDAGRLLVQQHGIGELRLLQPALAAPASVPSCCCSRRMHRRRWRWPRWAWSRHNCCGYSGAKASDALWAAEQILRSGCCGALLMWQQHARGETLRRLHLAAQSSETLFCMLRPLTAAGSLTGAIAVIAETGGGRHGHRLCCRRGPLRDAPLFLPLTPSLLQRHAPLDRSTPATAPARGISPALVGG
jgi:protein ImuA